MALVESLRTRPLLAFALLGALAGSSFGLLHPIAPAAAERSGTELTWQLPPLSVVARFDEKQFAAVQQRNIWGNDAISSAGGTGADGKSVLPWRLTGIILEPVPMALVLADGSVTVSRVGVGETLPDGGVLRAVTATHIAYQNQGCDVERRLYGDPEQKPEPHCGADATESAADAAEPGATERK